MRKIKLTQNRYALVDEDDFEYLNQWKWCVNSKNMVQRREKDKVVLMHRVVMNTPKGKETDHINMNRFDNRKSNLRVVTRSENLRNRKVQVNSNTGFKGVSFYKSYNKWLARISLNKRRIFLGYFDNIKDAVVAYNRAAIKYHGEFARLNKI